MKHAMLFALVFVAAVRAADSSDSSPMIGRWQGTTRVIVSWCTQSDLPVFLDIHADGTVAGRIGDAELTDARIHENGWRWLNGSRSTQVIKGALKGPIVAAQGVSRTSVIIHLRLDGQQLVGGCATNGTKFGGKDNMILTTTSLRLRRL